MLGRGSFGEVYKSNNEAVKVIRLKSWDDVASVVKELNVLERNLEGCIKFHKKSILYGKKYISYAIHMDLAQGDLRNTNPPPNADKQLLNAVHSLHSNNILHMDIKPENILVKGDQIFLCDFGLSTMEGSISRPDYIVSRWYRAPELYFSKFKTIQYTKAMDCWSVGCVLYEIKHKKLLNRKMSYVFNIEDITIRNLTKFHASNRWSIAKCLGLKESSTSPKKCTLHNFYETYFNENPAKLEILQAAQRTYEQKGNLDNALLQNILLLDTLSEYHFDDMDIPSFVTYI